MPQYYVLEGVKSAREKSGLSAADLAAKAGITQRTLAGIEDKSHGARRKLLLSVKNAINAATGAANFAADPVLTKGLAAPGATSTSKRFPKGIRIEYTKKRNRAVRAA